MRTWRYLVMSVVAVCVAWVPTASWATAPTPLTIPQPIGAVDAGLGAVSCPSDTWCVAVGSYQIEVRGQTGARRRLGVIETWNGTRWAITAGVPFAGLARRLLFLTSVSCASAQACMVLGNRQNYTTNPPGSSLPVSGRWDGARWRVTHLATLRDATASLASVSCDTAGDCTAVGSLTDGDMSRALVEHWNGRRWTVASTSPARSGISMLGDVACPTRSGCLAIGYQHASRHGVAPLMLSQQDGHWRTVELAIAGWPTLTGVSCPEVNDCLIVGSKLARRFSPIAERFDGQHLSAIPVTGGALGAPNSLAEVSCATSTRCLISGAIGAGEDNHGFTPGLAISELWDGTAFTSAFTGAFGTSSCRPTFCMMVGSTDHRITAHRYQVPAYSTSPP